MLSGELAVLRAPIFDGLSFDPFALFDDCWISAEVGGWSWNNPEAASRIKVAWSTLGNELKKTGYLAVNAGVPQGSVDGPGQYIRS